MMYPFMTLNDDTEITHSEMKPDGRVKVYIETPDEKDGFHHAVELHMLLYHLCHCHVARYAYLCASRQGWCQQTCWKDRLYLCSALHLGILLVF